MADSRHFTAPAWARLEEWEREWEKKVLVVGAGIEVGARGGVGVEPLNPSNMRA